MTSTLDINRSDNTAWAFTVKVLANDPEASLETYAPIIAHFNEMGYIKRCESELDPKGKLHIHGIILLRKNFYRKRLTSVPGFHILLEEIYDERGWVKYILKQQNGEGIIDNNVYMF